MDQPDYYLMNDGEDLFAWTRRLPIPVWLVDRGMLEVVGLWFTAFRYARRCLWKGPTPGHCSQDAAKASVAFARLADALSRDD